MLTPVDFFLDDFFPHFFPIIQNPGQLCPHLMISSDSSVPSQQERIPSGEFCVLPDGDIPWAETAGFHLENC